MDGRIENFSEKYTASLQSKEQLNSRKKVFILHMYSYVYLLITVHEVNPTITENVQGNINHLGIQVNMEKVWID